MAKRNLPLLSIIIPPYDSDKHFRPLLKSLLNNIGDMALKRRAKLMLTELKVSNGDQT